MSGAGLCWGGCARSQGLSERSGGLVFDGCSRGSGGGFWVVFDVWGGVVGEFFWSDFAGVIL